MAVTYHCDNCGAESTSIDNWLPIVVQFMWYDPSKPTPPGGRTLMGDTELLFDKQECVNEWAGTAKVVVPTPPVGMGPNAG